MRPLAVSTSFNERCPYCLGYAPEDGGIAGYHVRCWFLEIMDEPAEELAGKTRPIMRRRRDTKV
jgi:hypothetical protein